MSEPAVKFSFQNAAAVPQLPARSVMIRWMTRACELPTMMTVRFVDQEEGYELNHSYRHRDYATNVLTFNYTTEPEVTADVAICVPVVEREAAEIGERVAPEPFRKGPDACERGQLGGEPSAADFLRNPAGEGGKERKDGAQYKKRKRRNGPGQAPVDRNGVHRPGESRHEPAESEEKTHERGSGGRRTRREDEEEADERDERHPLPAKRIKPRAKEKPHAQGAERARRFGPALPPVRRLAHAT